MVTEPLSQSAQAVTLHTMLAPDLRVSECVNVLWKKVRRGEISEASATEAAASLRTLAVQLHRCTDLSDRALDIALALDHPAYDCFYLALAEQEQCPLITADDRLVRKLATVSGASFADVRALSGFA